MSASNPMRPKVKAARNGAAGGTAGVVVLVWVLRLLGVDVSDVPPEVLVLAAGGIATALATIRAYYKKDGLGGVWEYVLHGEASRPEDPAGRAGRR